MAIPGTDGCIGSEKAREGDAGVRVPEQTERQGGKEWK